MDPLTESHLNSLIEDLHLLEALPATRPETHSDLRALRLSIPLPQPNDPTQEARRDLTDYPPSTALAAAARAAATLDLLESTRHPGDSPLDAEWLSQARRVLTSARNAAASQVRANIADRISGLYIIVDPEATRGRPVLEVAEATLRGGANVIQLRDKLHDTGDVLTTARGLQELCASHGAVFIMNDDAAIALASGADGLHVGQTDLPVPDARRILSDAQIVGRSNNGVEEALESQAAGADYLAVGAVYATATMGKSARKAVGPEMIAAVKAAVSQPVVAIGGIDRSNVTEVVRAGADCVCVVSAVTMADSPEDAARSIVHAIQSARA